MSELGVVSRAVLTIVAEGPDERSLAELVCAACLKGLEVDGVGLSVLTGTVSRETSWVTDEVAELLEDLQFTSTRAPA